MGGPVPHAGEHRGRESSAGRPIDGVDQSRFFTGATDKSNEGFLIWVDNRLQAVKWHNYKAHFYYQETMFSPPVKLPLPNLLDLYTNPREGEQKRVAASWVMGPMLKMIAAFDASVKKYPLIPMGTPDPYQPASAQP
jgi:arylsulfatase